MSNRPDEDAGTIAALMIRFREYRLPRAKRLLEKVRGGEQLSEEDIRFLKRVYEDGISAQPVVRKHAEYHKLVVRAIDLYAEIMTRGVENEKNQGPG